MKAVQIHSFTLANEFTLQDVTLLTGIRLVLRQAQSVGIPASAENRLQTLDATLVGYQKPLEVLALA